MLTFFQRLLFDEAAFERFGRAALFALGQAMQQGLIPGTGKAALYAAILVQASALMVGAGTKPASAEAQSKP